MNKIFLAFFYLNLLCISLIFVYNYMLFNNVTQTNRQLILFEILNASLPVIQQNEFDWDRFDRIIEPDLDDEECELKGDWLSLDRRVFFKKTANYFILDLNRILVFYLHDLSSPLPSELVFSLTVLFRFKARNYRLVVRFDKLNYKVHEIGYNPLKSSFQRRLIVISFDFEEKVFAAFKCSLKDLSSLEMNLSVFDRAAGESLKMPLKLKIKSTPYQDANVTTSSGSGIAVCNKMVFVDNEEQLDAFRVWVEVNKRIGYDKLVVYFRSGFKFYPKLKEFLAKHERFVDPKRTLCIPNLTKLNRTTKYYTKLYVLNSRRDAIFRALATISNIYMAECYLDNWNFYRYIIGEDNDEFFLPMASHQVIFDQPMRQNLDNLLENSSKSIYIDPFELRNKVDHLFLDNRKSVILPWAQYIENTDFDRFCDQFKRQKPLLSSTNETHFFDLDIKSKFKIAIDPTNHRQIDYAQYLCDINERLVKPLMQSIKNPILKRFCRFFSNFAIYGKSIHSTFDTLAINLHRAKLVYDKYSSLENIPEDFLQYCDCGYVAHVRLSFKFGYIKNAQTYGNYSQESVRKVSQIQFDTNVFRIMSNIQDEL